jgi:hypothetical protein
MGFWEYATFAVLGVFVIWLGQDLLRLQKRGDERERRLQGRMNEAWKRIIELDDRIARLEHRARHYGEGPAG